MKIQIKNFKNISDFEFEIEKGKINSIFGISGCGKTSIAESLLMENFEQNVTIGKEVDEVNVLIDGTQPNPELFRYYDISTQNNLILEPSLSGEVYSILFGDTTQLDELKREINQLTSKLELNAAPIYVFKNEIEKVMKEFTGKITQKGDITKGSKLNKLTNDIINIQEDEESLKLIKSDSSEVLDWKIKGITINDKYKNKECPFCGNALDNDVIEFLESLQKITPKNFDIIKNSQVDFGILKVNKPKDPTDLQCLDKFKNDLIDAYNKSKELDEILLFLNNVKNPRMNSSDIQKINVSDETLLYFDGLKKIIDEINAKISEIKTLMGKMIREFDFVVGKNINDLNKYVEKLGIPYKFGLDDYNDDDKTAKFKLYHKDDSNENHRAYGLSFGEKNMLSLILFLLIEDDSILIIDDPASSYDDFRRKTILDIIYQFARGRTCLLLSHDHVFLKYSLLQFQTSSKKAVDNRSQIEKNYFTYTGKIYYFENLDSPRIKEVALSDFKPIETHITNHLSNIKESSSFYRKIINLRLLAEIKKYDNSEENNIIYSFLSALLHKKDKSEINSLLEEKGFNEQTLIRLINDKMKFDLVEVPDNYTDIVDYDDFTLFEKAIFKREYSTSQSVKDELNNLVHLNDSLLVQLNPYKFNLFSLYVYSAIINS